MLGVFLTLALAALDGGPAASRLEVHFFDVGHGNAALIISPLGKTVLVDGGPADHASDLVARLRPYLKGPIDLVVSSAPTPEMFGGLAAAVKTFGAARFLTSGQRPENAAHEQLLAGLATGDVKVLAPRPNPRSPLEPVRIDLGGAMLEVFWPRVPYEPTLTALYPEKANGIVMRLKHLGTSMLFASEAQPETEAALVEKGFDLASTLLVVADHGAALSSTQAFLDLVRPRVAVVSVGAGNKRRMPSRPTAERLSRLGTTVLRTDLDGDIDVEGDGERLYVRTSRRPPGTPDVARAFPPTGSARTELLDAGDVLGFAMSLDEHVEFAGSSKTKEFHRLGCPTVKSFTEDELILYPSRAQAEKTRTPAADCSP